MLVYYGLMMTVLAAVPVFAQPGAVPAGQERASVRAKELPARIMSFTAQPTSVTAGKPAFLLNRDVVSGQTTPLVVSKVGIDAEVSDFATRQAAAYGAIAVLGALVAGWLASLPFRSV